MRIVVDNILVAVGYFLAWLLMDYRFIKTGQDIFSRDPLTEILQCAMFSIPVAFFLANKGLFSEMRAPARYSLVTLISLALSGVWFVCLVIISFEVHGRIGGRP